MKARILSLAADPELGKLRAMLLRQAGYDVLWPASKSEAYIALRDNSFDLLLVGHTLSGQSAREFAEIFRDKNPNGKVVVIMAATYVMLKADKTVKAADGPEVLLQAIEELLESE